MFLQDVATVLDGQLVQIKYDCDGGFERCGKAHQLKLKDAKKNAASNGGLHICRSCQLRAKNPSKLIEVQEKIKQTNLRRYGTVCAMNTEQNRAARVEKMFGSQEAIEARTEKTKKTNLERYGVEHAAQAPEKQEKARETNRDRYGTDHPMQNEEIKERAQQTVLERHGVENVMQVPEIQKKQATTTLERYGVEYYNQLPEMKDYLRENCTTWLAESYTNPWAKGITRPEEWNEKQSATMTAKILRGELNPEDPRFYTTGYFSSDKCKKKRAFFRSSLELVMHYMLHIDEDVEWYENEPFSIEYEKFPGVVRRYIPDFFVMKKSGPELIELKPRFRMREEAVKLKTEAGRVFAKEKGFVFRYIDEKEVATFNVTTNELAKLPYVELIKMRQ